MIDKIKKILIRKKEPYLYDWFSTTKIKFSSKNKTICVNKDGNLFTSVEFLNKLSDDELVFVLYHELMHVLYEHLSTKKTNHYLVNVASDIYINELLISLGYVAPSNILLKKTFGVPNNVTTAEEIYKWLDENLTDEQKKKLNEFNDEEQEEQERIEDEEQERIEDEEQEGIEKILKKIKNGIEKKILKNNKIKEDTPVKWDMDLRFEIGRLIKRTQERNFKRPARYEPKGIIRPSYTTNVYVPKINMYIDKSGSMADTLSIVIAALKNIKNKLKDYIPTYYVFDTQVQLISENDLDEITPDGGTEFDKVIGNADLHIIITDGVLDFTYIDAQKNVITYLIGGGGEITKRIK